MVYQPTLLRSNERLLSLHRAKWEGEGERLVHIKVGSKEVTQGLRHGMRDDVMACGRRGSGWPVPGAPDANRASCRKCLEKYKPKRGQPPVKGLTP